VGWHAEIGFPILSIITYLPLAAALVIIVLGKGRPQLYKIVSLAGTLAAWVLSAVLLFKFDSKAAGFQFVEDFVWVRRFHIHYGFGVDGIAALLLFLTTLLGVVVIIASWNYIKDRERGFFVTLLLLQTGMSGVFLATDIFLFYVFWEVMLVPMYFIIGIWGGPRRIYAAIKFFLFTVVGSLLMLVAIIVVVYHVRHDTGLLTFNIQKLSQAYYPYYVQFWAFAAFFLAFAIKVPMFPLHTWLPDAHV
jgi:NADH-quinone oxidoreductase subunit M